MQRIEVHHLASLVAPPTDSHRRSCRNSRTAQRKGGGVSGTGREPFPLREKGGAQATQNCDHDLVHV